MSSRALVVVGGGQCLEEPAILVALHASMAQAGGVDLEISERTDRLRTVNLP